MKFFGVNISSSQVKVAAVTSSQEHYELESLGSFSLFRDGHVIDDLFNCDPKYFVTNINKLNLSSKSVVLSIPEDKVLTRVVTLPYLSDKEIEDAIYYSYKSLIPVDIESQNITYIPVFDNQSAKKISYYVASIDKDLALKYLNYFKSLGLNLLAIETESISNHRVLMFNMKPLNNECFLSIDIGGNSTNISLNTSMGVIYSQMIAVGSRSMTKLISADFGIEVEQAEILKINNGFDFSLYEGKIASSIKPVVDIILAEIMKLIAYHKDKFGQLSYLKIGFLLGGGAMLKGLDTYLSQTTNLLIVRGDPTKNIKIKPIIQKEILSRVNIFKFASAIGASIKQR